MVFKTPSYQINNNTLLAVEVHEHGLRTLSTFINRYHRVICLQACIFPNFKCCWLLFNYDGRDFEEYVLFMYVLPFSNQIILYIAEARIMIYVLINRFLKMQQKYSFNKINFYQKRKTYGKILFFIPKSNCYIFAWIFFFAI